VTKVALVKSSGVILALALLLLSAQVLSVACAVELLSWMKEGNYAKYKDYYEKYVNDILTNKTVKDINWTVYRIGATEITFLAYRGETLHFETYKIDTRDAVGAGGEFKADIWINPNVQAGQKVYVIDRSFTVISVQNYTNKHTNETYDVWFLYYESRSQLGILWGYAYYHYDTGILIELTWISYMNQTEEGVVKQKDEMVLYETNIPLVSEEQHPTFAPIAAVMSAVAVAAVVRAARSKRYGGKNN